MLLVGIRSVQLGILYPKAYLHLADNYDDRLHIFYFSRVVLYCLGVENRFNIMSWPTEQVENIMKIDFNKYITRIISNNSNYRSDRNNMIIDKMENFTMINKLQMELEVSYLAIFLNFENVNDRKFSIKLLYYTKRFLSFIMISKILSYLISRLLVSITKLLFRKKSKIKILTRYIDANVK